MSWDKGSRNTTYNLWNVAKSVLRGKFIAMNDCVSKEIFQSDCISLLSTNSARTFLFSTPSPAFIVCKLFDDGHSYQCEVISHCSFDLHFSKCQQIWKTQQWPQDWKRSVCIPIPKKGNAKECSNYRTIALISHASKVMLKVLQARIQ